MIDHCSNKRMNGTVSPQAQKQNPQTPNRKSSSIGPQKDLWLAVREGSLADIDSALAFLKKNGGNINSRNMFGVTPLHIATWRNHIPIVRRLLAAGADPDARVCYFSILFNLRCLFINCVCRPLFNKSVQYQKNVMQFMELFVVIFFREHTTYYVIFVFGFFLAVYPKCCYVMHKIDICRFFATYKVSCKLKPQR